MVWVDLSDVKITFEDPSAPFDHLGGVLQTERLGENGRRGAYNTSIEETDLEGLDHAKGYNTSPTNLCGGCFTFKSASGKCNCVED